MANNVYADEAAFAAGLRKMKAYTVALIKAGESYNEILQDITVNDIHDMEISMKINGLAVTVKQCIDAAENLGKVLDGAVGNYMDELESLDTFQFPNSLLNTISAILAAFM